MFVVTVFLFLAVCPEEDAVDLAEAEDYLSCFCIAAEAS